SRHENLPASSEEMFEQLLGHAGSDPCRGNAGADSVADDHLASVPLGKFVHVSGRDMGAFPSIQRKDRHLNIVILARVCGIDLEWSRIDDILAVMQHDHVWAVVTAKYLREHFVEHLTL